MISSRKKFQSKVGRKLSEITFSGIAEKNLNSSEPPKAIHHAQTIKLTHAVSDIGELKSERLEAVVA